MRGRLVLDRDVSMGSEPQLRETIIFPMQTLPMLARPCHQLFIALVLICSLGTSDWTSVVYAGPSTSALHDLMSQGNRLLAEAERLRLSGNLVDAQRKATKAERFYSDVVRQLPGHRAALLRGAQSAALGRSAARTSRWIGRLQASSKLGRNDPDVHFLRGFAALYCTDRPDQAVIHLTRMRASNPRARPTARETLMFFSFSGHGRALLKAVPSDPHGAAKQFAAAVATAKRLPQGLRMRVAAEWNLASAYRLGKRTNDAMKLYDGLRTRMPNDPRYHLEYALCAGEQNDFASAARAFRIAIRHWEAGKRSVGPPQQMRLSYLRLGNCLRHLGDAMTNKVERTKTLDEAKQMIRTYIKLEPTNSQGHRWLGDLLFEVEEKPYEALRHFERAHALDPSCTDALRRMIQIHELVPPPPGSFDNDDEDAKAKATEAWEAPVKGWQESLRMNEAKYQAMRQNRTRVHGFDGCS